MRVASVLLVILRLSLAAVFVISAFAKFADRDGFQFSLAGFGVPERFRPSLAALTPAFELLIAVGLLPGISAWFAAVSALGLLVVFTLLIVVNLVRRRRPECHGFGQFSSAPMGWGSVVRNSLLIAAAAAITVAGPANAGPNMVAWVNRLSVARPGPRPAVKEAGS
jgi:hypothetical protein